jgi:hypothetical protein
MNCKSPNARCNASRYKILANTQRGVDEKDLLERPDEGRSHLVSSIDYPWAEMDVRPPARHAKRASCNPATAGHVDEWRRYLLTHVGI